MPARGAGTAALRRKARMLPRTVPSWMERAACASHDDPDLWFAERGDEERKQEALRICAACTGERPELPVQFAEQARLGRACG